MVSTYQFNFYTSYHQFYICDKNPSKNTNSDTFWTDEAHKDRIAIENRILGIRTASYGDIIGELKILTSENQKYDDTKYDHIVEIGIKIDSGYLQLLDCPNSEIELEIKLEPDNYRLRIYYANLDSVNGDSGDDYYYIEIWKSTKTEKLVLKKHLPDLLED